MPSSTASTSSEDSPLLQNNNRSRSETPNSSSSSTLAFSPSSKLSTSTFFSDVPKQNLLAFVLGVLCCACAGSITLFSMFAPSLQHYTNLPLMDINLISIAAELGMYVPVPLLGYSADRFGPQTVGILASFLFCPSYFIASRILLLSQTTNNNGVISALASTVPVSFLDTFLEANKRNILVACFACIGTATSSLHFCGVVTAAKVLRKYPGLSISAPIAAFGISSLWQSQVIYRFFLNPREPNYPHEQYIRLHPAFLFFSVLYLFTGVISYMTAHVGAVYPDSTKSPEDDEESVPNSADSEPSTSSTYDTLNSNNDDTIENNKHTANENSNNDLEDNTRPSSGSASHEPYKQHRFLSDFLLDHTVWALFISFVLATGPLEMFINDMGVIMSTIRNPSLQTYPISTQVSIFSSFNTLTRLTLGILSDLIAHKVSRASLLAMILFCTAVVQFLTSLGVFTDYRNGENFYLCVILNGISYASTFTLFPAIVATAWGVERFGTNWGIFILGPALGSTFFGVLFAKVYDKAIKSVTSLFNKLSSPSSSSTTVITLDGGDKNLQCYGVKCYQTTFLTSSLGFVIATILLMIIYLRHWKPITARRSIA